METLDRKIVEFFLPKVASGDLQLPEFQRDFEWGKGKQRELVESLLQGHPAGSILLLTISAERPRFAWTALDGCGVPTDRTFGGTGPIVPPQYLVLDGQQRITTLSQLIRNLGPRSWFLDIKQLSGSWARGGKPSSKAGIVTWLEATDLEEAIVAARHTPSPRTLFSVRKQRMPLSLLNDAAEFTSEIRRVRMEFEAESGRLRQRAQSQTNPDLARGHRETADQLDLAAEFLDSPLRILADRFFESHFPTVFIPADMSVTGVCKVFTKLNTTGLPLDAFDLTVAKLYADSVPLKPKMDAAKAEHPSLKTLDESQVTLLSTLALLAEKSAKKASLPDTIDKAIVEQWWDSGVKALVQAGKVLTDHCGAALDAGDQQLLAYAPILPPLARVLHECPIETTPTVDAATRIDRIRKLQIWYFTTALHGYYSEGTDNKQAIDAREYATWFRSSSITTAKPSLLTRGTVRPQLSVVKSGALGKAVLSLLNIQKPKDWYETAKIVGRGDGRSGSDLHHIFPFAALVRSAQQQLGLSKDDAGKHVRKVMKGDCVLNLTWLLGQTNRDIIRDEKPSEYLPRIQQHVGSRAKLLQILSSHFISEQAFECLMRDDFENFLLAREEQIYADLVAFGVSIASNTVESQEDADLDSDGASPG